MTKNISSKAKQYIALILTTLTVVLLYLWCHSNGDSLFLSLDMDKPMDSFIDKLIQSKENGKALTISTCEYNIQNIIILLLSKIAGDVCSALNIYYVMSFFFITIGMFWFLRKLHVSAGIAIYGAIYSSLIPYHIDRGQGQIITSTFFLVPVFAGIFYDIIYEERVEKLNKGYMAVMCIAPFVDIKLSIMAMILMAILAVHRRKKVVIKITACYVCPMGIITFVLNQITSALNTENLEQSIQLAREEGMRILDMMMPLRYHVWDRLWNIRYEYDVSFAASGESGLNSMGTLLTIFFVISMMILFMNLQVDKRISWMAWISILVILISNVSGFNLLFEYFGLHLGYWNRMAIFIIVCTVAAMAILIEKLHECLSKKVNAMIINAGLLLIGVVGIAELLLRQNML